MRARGWLIVAIVVVVAGVGGYELRGTQAAARQGGASSAAGGFQRGGAGGFAGAGRGGFGGGGFQRGGASSGGSGTGATIDVQSVTVTSGPLVAQRIATGTVVPVTQSNVAAQSSGTVQTLLVGAGDDVKAGQPLIQLSTDALELAVANAKTALSTAEINLQTQQTNIQQAASQLDHQLQAAQSALSAAEANYASAQKVYALGGTSRSAVDSAKSQLDQARATLTSAQNGVSQNQRAQTESLQQLRLAVTQAQNGVKQAELNLANATIRAPFAGQVASFNVAPGEYVGPSTAVLTLVSADRDVQLSVPPSDAAAFAAGTKLSFNTSSAHYPIVVGHRPGSPVNQSVTVTVAFDTTTGAADVPAQGVVGTVPYKVTLATGTIIPMGAVQDDGTHTFVFAIQGGKAVQTNVTILAEAGSDAAVSGVPGNTEIVDQPPPGLLNGSTVATASGAAGAGASSSGAAAAAGFGARAAGSPGASSAGAAAAAGATGGTNAGRRSGAGFAGRFGGAGGQASGGGFARGTRPSGAPSGGAPTSGGQAGGTGFQRPGSSQPSQTGSTASGSGQP